MQTETAPSDLIALSFDGQASPSFVLIGEEENQASLIPITWGLGWYPDNQRTALRLRDGDVPRGSVLSQHLQDTAHFHSSLFLGGAGDASEPGEGPAAQPFVRSFAGRQWLFAATGAVSHDVKGSLDLEDAFEIAPVGTSAIEHGFSWVLSRLRARHAKTIDEFGWRNLHEELQRLNEFGPVNLLLSDGVDLVAYRDRDEELPLHWARLTPPHEQTTLRGHRFSVEVGAPMDASRSFIIVTSKPLRGLGSKPLEAGELRIMRRGACVWSTHPGYDEWAFRHLGPPRPHLDPRAVSAHDTAHQQQRAAAAPESRPGARLAAPRAEQAELSVVHTTRYRYENPVERSSHRFCLHPVQDERQRVLEHSLEINVEGDARDFEDVFGNRARVLEIRHPFQELEITSRMRVSIDGVSPNSLKWAYQRNQIPLVWMPWQRQMMQAYLMPPELPEPELRELSEFGMSFVERNDYDLVETLFDLNRTIYRDFEYVTGSTTVETTPFAVYTARKGVCQDFANVFICIARLLGVPARYRVGYIYTGGSYENKIQSDASHAWAEVYLPITGWFGFDPTNGCLAGADHVRVACGRQFRDAAPTAGTIYRGGGFETLEVEVRVEKG